MGDLEGPSACFENNISTFGGGWRVGVGMEEEEEKDEEKNGSLICSSV